MDTISGIWGSLTLRDVHQPSGWKANQSPSSQNVNTPKTTARCLQKAPVVLKPIGFGEILGVFQIGGRFLFQELLGNHQCQWRKIRCALSQLFPSVSKPPTLEISPPFGLVLLKWRWKILWHTPPASKKTKCPSSEMQPGIRNEILKKVFEASSISSNFFHKNGRDWSSQSQFLHLTLENAQSSSVLTTRHWAKITAQIPRIRPLRFSRCKMRNSKRGYRDARALGFWISFRLMILSTPSSVPMVFVVFCQETWGWKNP